MNCRQARIDLALCVGEDLPDAARRESLRQHVAQCPGCRAHYKRLRGALRVLESSDRHQTFDAGDSLWPRLSSRIRRLEESPGPASRFNGWLPFVAVTAACALLFVVMDVSTPTPSAPLIGRELFSMPTIAESPQDSVQGQAFLPIGLKARFSPEAYTIEQTDLHHAERAALQQLSEQPQGSPKH